MDSFEIISVPILLKKKVTIFCTFPVMNVNVLKNVEFAASHVFCFLWAVYLVNIQGLAERVN
jgi:hypothetical protein